MLYERTKFIARKVYIDKKFIVIMANLTKIMLVSVVLLFLFAASADGVGRSEGTASADTSVIAKRPAYSGSDLTASSAAVAGCEESPTRKDRIGCRLRAAQEVEVIDGDTTTDAGVEIIPEACRGVSDVTKKARCKQLYQNENLRRCYSIDNGREKNRCFMKVLGFTRVKISDETTDRETKTREYAVALLYDLEKRIETAFDAGRLTEEEASSLIDKIIEIKQLILNGSNKAEIRTKMQELKLIWKESIDGKLRICPDAWIDNQLPTNGNIDNRQYFIVNNYRRELAEFDVDWIRENCNLEIQIAR